MSALKYWDGASWQSIANRAVGEVIDIRTKNGAEEAYSGTFNGTFSPLADRTGGSAQNMRLSYTPPVDVWWEVIGHIGIVQKNDAAYHYAYGLITLTPSDVDGINQAHSLETQRSDVMQFGFRSMNRLFKLAANTSYSADLGIAPQSGGVGAWSYYCGKNHLWIQAKAYRR